MIYTFLAVINLKTTLKDCKEYDKIYFNDMEKNLLAQK